MSWEEIILQRLWRGGIKGSRNIKIRGYTLGTNPRERRNESDHSCKALARITTPQTFKIEGHIKKKNVQEVKDHIEHQEMNPTISCKGLEEITTPQTLKIEGHIKKKKVQAVKDHIEHQQQVLQLLKDNATSVQNQTKQQVD